MTDSLYNTYAEFIVNINNQAYNNTLTMVKTTQEFVQDSLKQNPYKDMFGAWDAFLAEPRKSKG